MKPLMLPIIAFVVFFAIGGGAGAYAMKPAAADSTHADSTHGDSAAADSTHGAGATLVPHAVEPDSATKADDPHAADPARTAAATGTATTAAAAGDHGAAPGTAGGAPSTGAARPGQLTIESLVRSQTGATVTMRPDGTIGPERPDSLPNYQRMASLLSKMGAREAARTIEQLNSTEAARALAAMSDKNAALVLAQLSPEKAAALLQATLALVPRTVTP